jgi:hypothetical protein
LLLERRLKPLAARWLRQTWQKLEQGEMALFSTVSTVFGTYSALTRQDSANPPKPVLDRQVLAVFDEMRVEDEEGPRLVLAS